MCSAPPLFPKFCLNPSNSLAGVSPPSVSGELLLSQPRISSFFPLSLLSRNKFKYGGCGGRRRLQVPQSWSCYPRSGSSHGNHLLGINLGFFFCSFFSPLFFFLLFLKPKYSVTFTECCWMSCQRAISEFVFG